MKNFNYRVLVLILTGTAALALAIGIGRFTYTPILPFMLEELNITKTEGGLIASWNFFGYLCGSLLSISSIFKKRVKLVFFISIEFLKQISISNRKCRNIFRIPYSFSSLE